MYTENLGQFFPFFASITKHGQLMAQETAVIKSSLTILVPITSVSNICTMIMIYFRIKELRAVPRDLHNVDIAFLLCGHCKIPYFDTAQFRNSRHHKKKTKRHY